MKTRAAPPALHHWSPITDYWPLFRDHLVLCLCFLLLTVGTGCSLLTTATNVPEQAIRTVTPGKQNKGAVDAVDLEEKLLRFADEFSTSVTLGIDRLRRGTNAPKPEEVLKTKIEFATEICSIASGPNSMADLLDMTVFVTLTRSTVEDYWQPKVFGESAQPLLESCRICETNIWQITGSVLKPEQQAELRRAIANWRRENPQPESVVAVRALGISSQIAQANRPKSSTVASVFDMLNVDPLSGLDPVTREIAQSRMFAERALYVAQRMPTVLRWQIELLALKATDTPVVRQLVTNSTEITESVQRFARVAEQLPGQISTERAEILKALQEQESKLTPLVNEVRQTLTAGAQMSTSLNTTIKTFGGLMQRFGVGETNQPATPPDTNSPPFNILDYGQTAGRVESMARQITELVRTLDETLDSTNLSRLATQMGPAVQQAQTGGKEVVDYAFWRGIVLVGIALAAALIYRFISTRLRPAPSSKLNPP
jgi:hypothetical protein